MKGLSHSPNVPYSALAVAPGPAAVAQFKPEETPAKPVPVQSAAACLSDQNSSMGQSSPPSDKQWFPVWETNWLWKSSVCRARLKGK